MIDRIGNKARFLFGLLGAFMMSCLPPKKNLTGNGCLMVGFSRRRRRRRRHNGYLLTIPHTLSQAT